MTHVNFKQAIREHIDQVSLDQNEVNFLYGMQENFKPKTSNTSLYKWAIAASVFIAVIFSTVKFFSVNDILPQVVNEVAANHISLEKVEIETDEFNQVAAFFDKLDFTPQLPNAISALTTDKLLGGRYCSIQGEIALQLRYGEDIDRSTALYIVLPNDKVGAKLKSQLSNQTMPYTTIIDNVRIKLWVEQGLLYAFSETQ